MLLGEIFTAARVKVNEFISQSFDIMFTNIEFNPRTEKTLFSILFYSTLLFLATVILFHSFVPITVDRVRWIFQLRNAELQIRP